MAGVYKWGGRRREEREEEAGGLRIRNLTTPTPEGEEKAKILRFDLLKSLKVINVT